MIHIIPISHMKEAARRIVFQGVSRKLHLSPFWKGRFEETNEEIRFPGKNIIILGGGSNENTAMGFNLWSSLVDEMAFMGKSRKNDTSVGIKEDKSESIYDSLRRRIRGTYAAKGFRGKIFLVSSKKSIHDFTERRIREAMNEQEPGVFVRDYATWDVRPNAFPGQKWHRAVVNQHEGRVKVLKDGEEPKPDEISFKFPDEYYRDFLSDPEGCFTGETKIALLDGRDVPIKDLVGLDEFWVYSFDKNGYFKPGRGHSARLTKKNAPIVEVELDGGERIRCTADHRFMLRDGSYVEAGSLTSGTSLMPLYRRVDKHGYEMFKSNVGGRWVHTHSMVASEVYNSGNRIDDGRVVHHKNFDRRDNSPSNLEPMLKEDHYRLHTQLLNLSIHSPAARAKIADSVRARVKNDPEYRKRITENLRLGASAYEGTENHIETALMVGKSFGFGRSGPTLRMLAARSKLGSINISKLNGSENNPIYKAHNKAVAELGRRRFGSSENPMFKEENRKKSSDSAKGNGSAQRANHARWKHVGSYESCSKCGPNNHKVVSVKPCGYADVYDISVDTWHNFALTDGVVVHNSARDIAGIALESFRPFFSNRQAIDDMQKPNRPHPFYVYEWDTGRELKILWENLVMTNAHGDPVPRCCPNAWRHCHIDLSKNKDATGFVVGHNAGEVEVSRRDPETHQPRKEEAPFMHIDLALRIKPPRAGEIDHQIVRSLIYKLRDGGLPIKSVTADTWMGLPNLQMIEKHGFETDQVSTQRTLDPYLATQSAMYERRIETPVYPILAKELRELELNDQGTKVDHPKTGCFAGDTKVKLLDGRSLTFEQLVADYGSDRPINVYTIRDGKVSVGVGHSPRLTKRNAEVVAVTLDNGQSVRCTPDHRFMLRDGTYREAANLKIGDSLMPLYTKLSTKSAHGLVGYELYKCPSDRKWHFTHRMVGRWKYPENGYTGNQYGNGIIHHERGKLNNDPTALKLVSDSTAHALEHREGLLRKRAAREPNNHKVVSVVPAGRADVYDLTVDETSNFALEVGVFVHNSKDVADAFAGTIYYLSTHHRQQGGGSVSRGVSQYQPGTPGLPTPTSDGNFRWPDEPPIPKPGAGGDDDLPSFIIT